MVEVARPRKVAAALKLNNASSEKRSGVQHQHTDIIVVPCNRSIWNLEIQ